MNTTNICFKYINDFLRFIGLVSANKEPYHRPKSKADEEQHTLRNEIKKSIRNLK